MGSERLYHLPGFYEPFSSFSHWLGAVVFLFLGWALLVRARNNRGGFRYVAAFAVAVVLMMVISGLFHMPPRGSPLHRVAERFDHAAIFVMIAGSFTPALGILFSGRSRARGLTIIWGAALVGITIKTLFFDRVPEWLGLSMYLGMGWFGAVIVFVAARGHGLNFVKPLLLGGLAYSIGAVNEYFQYFNIVPGVIQAHELHHVTVLIGAFAHWVWVWQFATWEPRADRASEGYEEPSPQTA
ncbi:MAG: DNA-binding protein [Gemmataceae bacterium]|nr:DNA-binding protein [Gemmataceae bacterium]